MTDWLRTAAAARYLGIGERHLRELAAAGTVPSYRPGEQLRFRRCDLDALIASWRVPVRAVTEAAAAEPEMLDDVAIDPRLVRYRGRQRVS